MWHAVLTCSVVSDLVTSWTVAHQGPLSIGFSRQEYWSGLSFPPPGDFPDPKIKLASPTLAGEIFFFNNEPPGKPLAISLQIELNVAWDICSPGKKKSGLCGEKWVAVSEIQ